MTTSNYKSALSSNLKDKEYRRAFVRSHIRNGIAFQIHAMREKKPWTQEQLAKQIGKQQAAISRLENPDYGRFTLKTLEELADVFDVALIVRFAPFGDLADWDLTLSSKSFERIVEFEEDPYFKEGLLGAEPVLESAADQYLSVENDDSQFIKRRKEQMEKELSPTDVKKVLSPRQMSSTDELEQNIALGR